MWKFSTPIGRRLGTSFFGYPHPNIFSWLQKLKKIESKSIFQGKTSQMGCGWLDFVEFLLYHS